MRCTYCSYHDPSTLAFELDRDDSDACAMDAAGDDEETDMTHDIAIADHQSARAFVAAQLTCVFRSKMTEVSGAT